MTYRAYELFGSVDADIGIRHIFAKVRIGPADGVGRNGNCALFHLVLR